MRQMASLYHLTDAGLRLCVTSKQQIALDEIRFQL